MKKLSTLFAIIVICLAAASFIHNENEPVPLPASPQRPGDAERGYQYLITGDYIKSGIPYMMFKMARGTDQKNYLKRIGSNAGVSHEYTAVKASNGELVVAPNCLQCHSQVVDDQLYVGMGNSFVDFSVDMTGGSQMSDGLYKMLEKGNPKAFKASRNFLVVTKALGPHIKTEVRGVNSADHLASVLAAHRDPLSFKWSDAATLDIPKQLVPTDVPAWWLLKKKNAMFYSGFGRGDFPRFLMASNLLTTADTAEARDVFNNFHHVLAYIYSIEAPEYPKPVDDKLASHGKALFSNYCSGCHGTYGEGGKYPNLLIPADLIGTDTALYSSNYSSPQFIDWFNKSWFTMGENPAKLVPFRGYIAPPLDGVWITAPYLHNGSVPTLEGVLNSKARPTYWSRDFDKPVYDYDVPGWKYTQHSEAAKGAYNTTLYGYNNTGHYFGDRLGEKERRAVIEYLKTL